MLRLKIALVLFGGFLLVSILAATAALTISHPTHSGTTNGTAVFRMTPPDAPTAEVGLRTSAEPLLRILSGADLRLAVPLAILVLGSAAILSLVVAGMVVRPLAMFEQAAAAVDDRGHLPRVPEKGSGEAMAAAKLVNLLSDRLKAAVESRMRLVAAAGHDLRTPMTRMRLMAEFLPDDDRDSWIRNIDELEEIANSAILLVREEAATPEALEAVSVSDTILCIMGELTELGLDVVVERAPPAYATIGSLALKRALSNLIRNAATHGGSARVTVSAGPGGKGARVVVRDDGPGIPENLIERAFEPFFRADPSRKKVGGAGLGMAIAKEIVSRVGGTISISNRTSGGLEQIVTLPS